MKNVLLFLSVIVAFSCNRKQASITYPASPKGDVVDTLFGTAVADPYR